MTLLALALVLLAAPAPAATKPAATKPAATKPAATHAAPSAAEARRFVVPLRGLGLLELTVPAGWTHAIQQPPGETPPTLQWTLRGDESKGVVMLTPLWSSSSPMDLGAPAIRASLEREAAGINPLAKVRALEGATGAWFNSRDPEAPRGPGDFEWLTRMQAASGKVLLSATVLTHEENPPMRQAAFAMIAGARVLPLPAGAAATIPVALTLPGRAWSVALDLPGDFAVEPPKTSPDGAMQYVEATDDERGLTLTVHVEPVQGPGGAKAHRDILVQHARDLPTRLSAAGNPGIDVKNLKSWEDGERAFVAYDTLGPEGMGLMMRSQNLVLVRDGSWVDVHLSHSQAGTETQAIFDAIMESVRIE